MNTITATCRVAALLAALAMLSFPTPPSAAPQAGGQSIALNAGSHARYFVTVERGEALVAHLLPTANSSGSTRLEAYVDGGRIGRVSGSGTEVLRWVLPMSVATQRMRVELRFTCRSGSCAGRAQWTVSTSSESPAPLVSPYLNQRSIQTVSGVCKNDSNATTSDGFCMCSDASAAMALTLAGGVRITSTRQMAERIFSLTKEARRPYGGAQLVGSLIAAIQADHDYVCRETKSSSSAFERQLKESVRLGDPVLFRSPRFSSAGHYVQVIGFKQDGTDLLLTVNDPQGRWVSRASGWVLNTTSANSRNGAGVTYRLSALRNEASVIICTP